MAEIAANERPRSRVFQCALVSPEYQGEWVTLRYGGTMSVLAGVWNGEEEAHARLGAEVERRETYTLEVPARVLSTVLDQASISEIDLMTLDVEGFEAPVLRGLDLSRHAPRFLLVEILPEKRERGKIEAILGAYSARGSAIVPRPPLPPPQRPDKLRLRSGLEPFEKKRSLVG